VALPIGNVNVWQKAQGMDLDAVLFGTELKLVTRQDLRSDDKYFADAYKVYMNLLWLGGAVGLGAGDEAGAADYKPRDVAYDILADQLAQLAAAQKDFEKHLNTGSMSRTTFNVVRRLGQVGYVARGVVFALVGGLIIKAAVDHEPGKAEGIDAALKTVADARLRSALLIAAALFPRKVPPHQLPSAAEPMTPSRPTLEGSRSSFRRARSAHAST